MGDLEKPQIAPLVIALTRPRMMWGVPIGLFVGELMVVVMTFLNTKNLATFLANVVRMRFAKCPWVRNRHFWGGNSYQP
jgi:type IV secretion system protein VirB3